MTTAEQMKSEMMLNGPIVALLFLYDDFLLYKSGVYSPMATANALTDKSKQPILHAVVVLGWGTDEAGQDYFLIQNSFGADWGEGGFGKVRASHKQQTPDYNPLVQKDIVLLENFVISATPLTKMMAEILEA